MSATPTVCITHQPRKIINSLMSRRWQAAYSETYVASPPNFQNDRQKDGLLASETSKNGQRVVLEPPCQSRSSHYGRKSHRKDPSWATLPSSLSGQSGHGGAAVQGPDSGGRALSQCRQSI